MTDQDNRPLREINEEEKRREAMEAAEREMAVNPEAFALRTLQRYFAGFLNSLDSIEAVDPKTGKSVRRKFQGDIMVAAATLAAAAFSRAWIPTKEQLEQEVNGEA